MTADPPSFVADVAAQVVAWHNRHPLARRITRKDVQGVGIVTLPYARDGQRPWDAPQPKRGLLALMFPPRQHRRVWPVFSEDLLPEIGIQRVVKFATRHGQTDRPGPMDLPERVASFDRDLLDAPGAEFPPERLNRYLVTAAIDIGPARPRLLLGAGKRPEVLGPRLWSLPRLAALGGGLLLVMVFGVAGLWLKAMPQRGTMPTVAAKAGTASAPQASAAPVVRASAAGRASMPASVIITAPASAPPAASTAFAPATAPATSPAALPASALATPASAASRAPVPVTPSRLASAISVPASASVPKRPPAAAPLPVEHASVAAPAVPSLAEVARASTPLVPRLRPDLAASARAESPQPGGASRPVAGLPDPGPGNADRPRPAASAAQPGVARFYALVTRPVRSKAEAESMLRRLRAETDRIAHPTATQTALQESRDGWRVTWWPFTNPRQAENARVALARRIELEMVDF
ncbi:hypothetical protein [Aquabacterium sp.]|uniref:hypothetical protein n=1 Tax=Aquabacterium sp. TaxID=1872578 RepID=UPI002CA9E5B6|nr:hypothetical protein [Aquabacterium sp.]HSW04900.1 hypothetical protein [Aquabacterium sp.]